VYIPVAICDYACAVDVHRAGSPMKTYKIEQRTRTWQTVAIVSELSALWAMYEKLAVLNGKRIVRSDGRVVTQALPVDYRTER
jgi:hypothetical protein